MYIKKKNYGLALFALMFFAIHVAAHLNYWDDMAWKDAIASGKYKNVFDFVVQLYNTTDGRVILNATHWFLSILPGITWRVLDILVVGLFYYDICKLCVGNEEDGYSFAAIMICIYPFSLQATAGWMTTTTNYLWPEAFGLYCLLTVLDYVNEKKVSLIRKIVAVMCAVYAGSDYMSGAILIGSLLIICVITVHSGKKVIFAVSNAVVAAAILFILLLSPSNHERNDAVATIFGGFDLNIFEKLRWALSSVFAQFLAIPSAMLMLFCLTILGLALFSEAKDKRTLLIGTVPIMLDIAWSIYFFIVYTIGRGKITYVHYQPMPGHTEKNEQVLLAISFIVLCIASSYVLFKSLRYMNEKIFCIYVLACGLAPEIVLGMTPMMDQSLIRVMTYMYFSFIGVIVFIVTRYHKVLDVIPGEDYGKKRAKKIYIRIYKIVLIIGVVLNILQLIHHISTYG